MNQPVSIAVSALKPRYAEWLNRLLPGILLTDLTGMPVRDFVRHCASYHALVLSGGGDIHPGLYGRPEMLVHCSALDPKRDELETAMVKEAISRGLPLLGICRGMQLINVALGGTLLADIPLLGNGTICHKGQEDMEHPVHLKTDTLLFQAARCTNAIVNSSHHQAVEQVAAGFRISAASPDGLTEGMEWEDTDAWYCMAVQWHPERMDIIHPLSGGFGKAFVEKVVSRIHEAKQSL